MTDEQLQVHFPFILITSSFILSLMSTKKLLNVFVVSFTQALIGAAENDVAFAHHHHFAVNQAKPFALSLKYYLPFVVYHSVFRAEVFEIIHLVGNEY
jgi:hypothetical protein